MKIIKKVTAEGLFYIDEKGLEGFINFKDCNNSWILYRQRKEHLDDITVANIRKHDNCIGQRDSCAQPSFIEFFTYPKFIRFEFGASAGKETKYSFDILQRAIIAAGWSTLDLS
jgi:hypothetical protein